MTPEEFRNIQWQKPAEEPERDRRRAADAKKFWYLCVPLGAVFGFFACVIGQSGGFFIPVWGLSVLALWGIFSSANEGKA